MKELNKMSFSNLLALKTFINQKIPNSSFEDLAKWKYKLAIVQQHIDKSLDEYFN